MLTKKYFSISEVVKMSCLPAHRLRYIEKSDPNIAVIKIRGRRYYTKDNINYIKEAYSTVTPGTYPEFIQRTDTRIVSRIDQLLDKFSKLTK